MSETTTCRVCGKTITVLKNGTLRHHVGHTPSFLGAPFKDRCKGSGTKAKEDR